MSARTNNQVAINPHTGEIAYPAGSFIALYNSKAKFLQNDKQRVFHCVAFSEDGVYLAAGEGIVKQPEVTIWKLTDEGFEVYAQLKGHKLAIEALCFSPDSKYLISLGDRHDRGLFLWDLERKVSLIQNKLSKPVRHLAFEETGKYFVTAGHEHLKFWHFDEEGYPILSQRF